MVLKAKSETLIKPLKNVTEFTTWQVPTIESSNNVPGFHQPVEEVEEEEEISEEEKAKKLAEEIQLIKDSAYKEGFELGKTEGFQSAEEEVNQQVSLLKQTIHQLVEPIKQCGQKTHQQLIELAFAIARQIVRRELKQDPTQLVAIIRDALKLLPVGSHKIKISLHPEDAAAVRNVLSIDDESAQSKWEVKNDPSVARGGCLVETENSKVDASIDKQIAVLFSRVAGGQRAGEIDAD